MRNKQDIKNETKKKNYYSVTFQYNETIFCSNLAHAENADTVQQHYEKEYRNVSVREVEDYEVESAKRRGMPIVEIETEE